MAIYGSRPGGESDEDGAAGRHAGWGDQPSGQQPQHDSPGYRPEPRRPSSGRDDGYGPPARGGAQVPGTYGSPAPGTYGSPTSGPPGYGPPTSGPPGYGPPTSGPPGYGPAAAAFGAAPGLPSEPDTDHWSDGGEDWEPPMRERPAAAGAAAPPPPRRALLNRTTLIVAVVLAVFVGAGAAGAAYFTSNDDDPPGATPPPAGRATNPGAAGAPAASSAAGGAQSISMSATGDIVMGMAPNALPPNNGKGFFDQVKNLLAADFRMGNLEQVISNDTGVGKCGAGSANCFAFRTPPESVQNLVDGGFHMMNLANNHANDYGDVGLANTRKALEGVGIKHTGAPGQISVAEVKGLKVAVVGFASYKWSNLCSDIPASTKIITDAAKQADIVVVQVHMGGEGADKTHVKPGTEIYLGEDRCDPIKFSHAVVDAGADLVVGHGPHVVRGMEFYKGRLIAYSLGNFGAYKALQSTGIVGVTAVINVSLKKDGSWAGGKMISTKMVGTGTPAPDPAGQAQKLIGDLSKQDFPQSGAKIAADGALSP